MYVSLRSLHFHRRFQGPGLVVIPHSGREVAVETTAPKSRFFACGKARYGFGRPLLGPCWRTHLRRRVAETFFNRLVSASERLAEDTRTWKPSSGGKKRKGQPRGCPILS